MPRTNVLNVSVNLSVAFIFLGFDIPLISLALPMPSFACAPSSILAHQTPPFTSETAADHSTPTTLLRALSSLSPCKPIQIFCLSPLCSNTPLPPIQIQKEVSFKRTPLAALMAFFLHTCHKTGGHQLSTASHLEQRAVRNVHVLP